MQAGQSARPQYMQTATASAVLWLIHFIKLPHGLMPGWISAKNEQAARTFNFAGDCRQQNCRRNSYNRGSELLPVR
jgi:hypothetical protein